MRSKRRCPYCHKLFRPCPRSFRSSTGKCEQRVCSDPTCQQKRRLQNLKDHWHDNPLVGSSLQNYYKQQQAWRQEKGRAYMQDYRKDNKTYVERNRKLQQGRDREKRNLVKQDSILTKSVDNLRQIQRLPHLVKLDSISDIQARQIDGICRHLIWTTRLVKQDSIALQKKIKQNLGHGTTS